MTGKILTRQSMKKIMQIIARNSKFLLLVMVLFGCEVEPVLWEPTSAQQVISEYVETNPEFSEFHGLLTETGISSLLAVRGPFTLFLPANTEMQAYYQEKGVRSYQDFTAEFQKQLVLNHIITSQIETGDIGLGALREVNGIGDYIVSEFEGSDIILNKNSKVIKRDIRSANGIVHLINRVFDPVTKSVYEVLSSNPDYSIFTEGLNLTNLKDTLQTISFPFGTREARTRFTILAITNTTFQQFGINSVDDLISKFTDDRTTLTQINNGFYRYMEYHCLAETYYLSDLETRGYPTLSYDNNVSLTVTDDYKINLKDNEYTGFIIELSNIPGKNGTIHTINNLLPVFEPVPTTYVWETTDHFDMKQGDYYGKNYMRFFDGQNTFKNIKWEGDYLLYYYKDHDTGKLMNHDCLSMSGWWWVEVTTPKIMKGSYNITSNLWSGQTDYAVYVDGVNTAMIKSSDPAESTSWGEFKWETTKTHTIKVVTTTPGLLFWDTVIFTPIK
jgi:uncharacterized surface protein with fasciclin (FAS1) repeats